jgi:hypothetical protein
LTLEHTEKKLSILTVIITFCELKTMEELTAFIQSHKITTNGRSGFTAMLADE